MLQTSILPSQLIEDLAVPITTKIEEHTEFLIDGILPDNDMLGIVGETNVGKSALALEIVSCLSTGAPLWGSIEPNRTLKRILYVLGEHRTKTIIDLARKMKLPMSNNVLVLGPEKLYADKWLVSQGRPQIAAIEKFKTWVDGSELVVWDPMASFLLGQESENDNVQMRLLIEAMNNICMSVGAACLVLGHKGKPTMDQSGAEHRRKSYATRGASGTEDAFTNIFYLNKGEGVNSYELIKRKFKGDVPDEFKLLRNPETITHVLADKVSLAEFKRKEYTAKMARLEAYNYQLEYRTRVRLIAAMEALPEQTIWRHLGKPLPDDLKAVR